MKKLDMSQDTYKDYIDTWDNLWTDHKHYAVEYTRRVVTFKKIELIRLKTGLDFSSSNQLLLDAGCGNGHSVSLVSQLFGLQCYGVDIVEKVLPDASTSVKYTVADVRELPFAQDTFDYVLSFGVVEHFKDTGRAVAETYRVLRPGGWALFVQPNRFSLCPPSRLLLQAIGKWRFGYQVEFTPAQMVEFLKQAGFGKIVLFTDDVERSLCPPLDKLIRRFFPQWGWYIFCLGRK